MWAHRWANRGAGAAGIELDTALPHDEQKRAVSTNRVPQSMQNMILTP